MKRHIPNAITCLNIAVGTIGIYFISSTKGLSLAIYFVLVAGLLDFLDGLSAKLLNARSEIGKQLDSLADLVSFGVLPSIVAVQWIGNEVGAYWQYFGLLIVVFSALRLARFNIENNNHSDFIGLPTPANAILITALCCSNFHFTFVVRMLIICGSSYLLISKIRFTSLKFIGFKWVGNQVRWMIVVVSLSLFIVLQETYLPLLIPVYIALSQIGQLIWRENN